MNFEITLAVETCVQVMLCLVHAFKTRTRAEAWLLLVMGIGFGYIFPLIDINIMKMYTFSGQLTLLNIPFYLGFAWYSLFYLAFCIAELMLGGRSSRNHLSLAVLCGCIFGLMETQWDPTLLAIGMMEFSLPSFAEYPWNFNPGVPFAHVFFGFSYAFLFMTFRTNKGQRAKIYLLSVGSLVVFPLILMLFVPLLEPVYNKIAEHFAQWTLVIIDLIHFSTSFFGLCFGFVLWIRWAGRKLGVVAVE